MKALAEFPKIYLHIAPVDFRMYINGLVSIVERDMEFPPMGGGLFVFVNRSHQQIRLLYWDDSGFALWMKRLEQATFSWPKSSAKIHLSSKELSWLLAGLDIEKSHQKLRFDYIH